MALSSVYDVLKEGGSRIMTLIKGQPLLQRSVDYINNHPWASLGVATGAYMAYKIITRPRNLPPGPFGIPFIGPLFVLQEGMDEKFLQLRETYGDVIYMTVMGIPTLYLNSARVIREAFIKREVDFSHRRPLRHLQAFGLDKDEIFTAPYNTTWKANKKFAVMALKNSGFGTAKSEIEINQNITQLEKLFLEKDGQPFSPLDGFKICATANICSISFSEKMPYDDHRLIKLKEMIGEWFEITTSTKDFMLSEVILYNQPLLARIICHGYFKRGYKASQELIDYLRSMIQEHRASFDGSTIRDVIDHYIYQKPHLDDAVIAANISITLSDAVDTTSLVQSWLLFYLAYFMEVQKKLKEEVDDVLGRDQNPSGSDKSKLSYAVATILETLRYSNIIDFGGIRMTNTEIEFEGYKIPKGTCVLSVNHSVHFDPAIFSNPENFDPERFLDAKGKVNPGLAGNVILFGLGPRMCMGEQYTKSILLLHLVRLAQKFDITFDPSQPKPPLKSTVQLAFRPPPEHKLCMTPRPYEA